MGKSKTVSAVKGKGSIRHNNRNFYAGNVDKNRTKDNIIYKQNLLEKHIKNALKLRLKNTTAYKKEPTAKLTVLTDIWKK